MGSENIKVAFPKVYPYIENTMFVSLDIKFVRRDQKQCMNDEACRASPAFSVRA